MKEDIQEEAQASGPGDGVSVGLCLCWGPRKKRHWKEVVEVRVKSCGTPRGRHPRGARHLGLASRLRVGGLHRNEQTQSPHRSVCPDRGSPDAHGLSTPARGGGGSVRQMGASGGMVVHSQGLGPVESVGTSSWGHLARESELIRSLPCAN